MQLVTLMSEAKLKFLVREMISADSKAVADISLDLGYSPSADDIARRFSKLQTLHDNVIFVGVIDLIVVGWCHVYGVQLLESDGYAEIGGLVVDSAHHRKGMGTALIRQSEQWALTHGYSRLRLRSGVHREDAHRFYETVGYSKSKASYAFERKLVVLS